MSDAISLKGLYQSLDFERPLDIADQHDARLYVPGLHTTNGLNPIDELRASLEMSERPKTWLFTGHRGVGKSTELRRLKAELDNDHLVILADVGEYLNLNEAISTESLLVTVIAALADGADSLLGGTRSEQSYVQRFMQFVESQIEIKDVTIKTPIGSAKITLKQNPDLLEQVKTARAGNINRLVEQVRKFTKDVVADVAKQRPNKPLVLILDSLEQLRVTGGDAKSLYDAIQRTFGGNGEYLKLDHLHVVYSVPPYLPFLIPGIGSYFGTEVCTLPRIKVFETPAESTVIQAAKPCANGQRLMAASIEKRYPQVAQLIPTSMLEQLALSSSGSMRDFFRLVRSVCTKAMVTAASLPLSDGKLVTLAEQMLRNEMPLAENDKVWLKKVRQSHGTGLDSINNLHELARLFDNGVILNYRNGHDWCEVHYLLHDQLNA